MSPIGETLWVFLQFSAIIETVESPLHHHQLECDMMRLLLCMGIVGSCFLTYFSFFLLVNSESESNSNVNEGLFEASHRVINCNIGLGKMHPLHHPLKTYLTNQTLTGTAGLGDQTQNIVRRALELGVTVIDSAQAGEWYSEVGVGDGLAIYGATQNTTTHDVVIVTKIHPRSFELQKMQKALAKSQASFGRNYLDVVLLHFPRCQQGQCTAEESKVSWQTGWKNLEHLRTQFNIKEIGVSNFEHSELQTLLQMANSKVSVIQNWMDPFHQDGAVRELAHIHHVQYMAYSSFGTQWGRKYNHNVVFHNPALERIAQKHGTSIAKVTMSWLYLQNVVAIPRSTKIDHLEENFALMKSKTSQRRDIGACEIEPVPLDRDDMELIRSLDGILGTPWD